MINKNIKEIIPSIIIAIVSVIFIFTLHFLGAFNSMELKLVDFRFNLRGPIYHDSKGGCYSINDDEILDSLDSDLYVQYEHVSRHRLIILKNDFLEKLMVRPLFLSLSFSDVLKTCVEVFSKFENRFKASFSPIS